MSDRELLELAAQAAGYEVQDCGWPSGMLMLMLDQNNEEGERMHQLWNPFTDDGDALRLAVKLSMSVDIITAENLTEVQADRDSELSVEVHSGDAFTATRRAIVRAAATIAKLQSGAA